MRVTNLHRVLLICGLASWAAPGFAAEGDAPTAGGTNTMQTTTARESIFGKEQITRAYVTSGKKTFTFVVPQGYRVDSSNPEELILAGPGFSNFISLHVRGEASAEKPLSTEMYRGVATGRFSDAEIVEEFSLSAANASGPAFELHGKTATGLARSARVAFIPCGGQVVEFCLTANPEKYGPSLKDLQTLMLTFRVSDAGGKPDIAVLSEKI